MVSDKRVALLHTTSDSPIVMMGDFFQELAPENIVRVAWLCVQPCYTKSICVKHKQYLFAS